MTELVEAEALAAEAEPDDAEEPSEPEPDDEELEEEEEPESLGPSDTDLRKFESENARHEKALDKIMGADFEHFAACAQCDGVGFVPEQANAALPFEHDPQRETCDQCKGYGTTLTGAREPGMVTMACSRCQGSGWTTVAEQQGVQPLPIAYDSAAPATESHPPNGGAVDPRVAALQAEGFIIVAPVSLEPAPGS